MLEGEFVFVLLNPNHPSKIGLEAVRFVDWAAILSKSESVRNRFENVVRQGFDYNFEQEGIPSGKWQELADLTKRERREMQLFEAGGLVPGFSEDHPILQRTGRYRQSWVNMNDQDAYSESFGGAGNFFMFIGSDDPRVAKLSGGGSAPLEEALESEYGGIGESEGGQTSFDGMDMPHPWARIPPRPVNELFEQFEEALTAVADSFGDTMANIKWR